MLISQSGDRGATLGAVCVTSVLQLPVWSHAASRVYVSNMCVCVCAYWKCTLSLTAGWTRACGSSSLCWANRSGAISPNPTQILPPDVPAVPQDRRLSSCLRSTAQGAERLEGFWSLTALFQVPPFHAPFQGGSFPLGI